jgi:hypothetical protein
MAAIPAMEVHQAVTTVGGGGGGCVGFLGRCGEGLVSALCRFRAALAGFARKLVKIGADDPRRVTHSLKVGLALTLVSVLYYVRPIFNNWGLSTLWAVLTVAVVMEYTVGKPPFAAVAVHNHTDSLQLVTCREREREI